MSSPRQPADNLRRLLDEAESDLSRRLREACDAEARGVATDSASEKRSARGGRIVGPQVHAGKLLSGEQNVGIVLAEVQLPPLPNVVPIGLPLMRALWLHHHDDPAAVSRGDQFLWGRDILVYDKRTLLALQQRFPKLPAKDYREYCYAWIALFTDYADPIAEACATIDAQLILALGNKTATSPPTTTSPARPTTT